MNKFQSYIYLSVFVLLLLGIAVFWSNKQEITPATDNEPVVDLSVLADNIDTSNWKTFRHEVYPYEIKYPEEGDIRFSLMDPNEYPDNVGGQRIDILPKRDLPGSYISIESNIKTTDKSLNNIADLETFVENTRDKSVRQYKYNGATPKIERITGVNWVGYQYSMTLADQFTWLYIINNNKTYLIRSDDLDDGLVKEILSTLRFLK